MPYDPQRHHRRSIRLRGYDYRRAGVYFVTICTHARRQLFDKPQLRKIAEYQWAAMAHANTYGERVTFDAFVVMPDHVHGVIIIHDQVPVQAPEDDVGAQQQPPACPEQPHLAPAAAAAPLRGVPGGRGGVDPHDDPSGGRGGADGEHEPPGGIDAPINVAPGSLGMIVRAYKVAVARRVNTYCGRPGAVVWQRGYYERIVRDERGLAAVRRYIANNPRRFQISNSLHCNSFIVFNTFANYPVSTSAGSGWIRPSPVTCARSRRNKPGSGVSGRSFITSSA
jgi:putative transposase